MSSIDQLEQAYRSALDALAQVDSPERLDDWYRATLSKRGDIQQMTRQVGRLPAQERPAFGQRINHVKQALQAQFDERQQQLQQEALAQRLDREALDVTLPGRPQPRGGLHPSTRIMRRIYRIFGDMGFQIYRSSDVTTDELNFQLLNMPPEHPARDMQDSFYTEEDGVMPRTHTSAGQILAMRANYPNPVRVILPGMCYRNEQITVRSEIQFHQIEGLAVGRNITFADLKGTLVEFAKRMYGADRDTRFRASYFPFTEPSAELDVSCIICGGSGCRLCKQTGWLEILGCGMVHPTVLRNGGYDPSEWSGFAFGMGPERQALQLYGIEDIRYFWGNDLRFLQQF